MGRHLVEAMPLLSLAASLPSDFSRRLVKRLSLF